MDVSVVIPTYNRESTIRECIMSVLMQTERPLEIIVVDDHSSDRTVEIVRELKRQYGLIKLLMLKSNHGAQYARNCGIKFAKGEWIAFLDSDDYWLSNKLEIQKEWIQNNPNYDAFYGDYYVLKNGKKKYIRCKMSSNNGDLHREILFSSKVLFQTLIVKRKALMDIGMLDINVPAYQEWDTNIRLSSQYRYFYINKPLFLYNLHDGDTISKDGKREIAGFEYVIKSNVDLFFSVDPSKSISTYYDGMRFRYERHGYKALASMYGSLNIFWEYVLQVRYINHLVVYFHNNKWKRDIEQIKQKDR